MDKYYIEYSGTEETTSLANDTKEVLEHYKDIEVELVVGEPTLPRDEITLYDAQFNKLLAMSSVPTQQQLKEINFLF